MPNTWCEFNWMSQVMSRERMRMRGAADEVIKELNCKSSF
jgi:hypothetical protein